MRYSNRTDAKAVVFEKSQFQTKGHGTGGGIVWRLA